MVFVGEIRPAAARLQALASSPPGCFDQPGDGGLHIRVGGGVRVFALAVLPKKPTEVTVLADKMEMQGWEYYPCQQGPQVLPVLKVQVSQVRAVAQTQP